MISLGDRYVQDINRACLSRTESLRGSRYRPGVCVKAADSVRVSRSNASGSGKPPAGIWHGGAGPPVCLRRRHPQTIPGRLARNFGGVLCGAMLAGCASTTVTLTPSPQSPVCDRTATALVLWAPQWRPDQKDVSEREEAAATGLQNFLAGSDCFRRSELRRIPDLSPTAVSGQAAASSGRFTRVVAIGVRELGPVVKLLSSAALVEGGTEVVLLVATYSVPAAARLRRFTVHWRNGGPGVIKGVADLPSDMQAALLAGLQPGTAAK